MCKTNENTAYVVKSYKLINLKVQSWQQNRVGCS